MDDISVVEYFHKEDKEGHHCGYCKSEDGSISYGMWAHSLTCEDYQDLIDRGWRRSGKYCYRPIMKITCCPTYTIRCDAVHFSLSRSQKVVLKRMRQFLEEGKRHNVTADEAITVVPENHVETAGAAPMVPPPARLLKPADSGLPSVSQQLGAAGTTPCEPPPFLKVGVDGKKPLEAFLQPSVKSSAPAHTLEVKLIRSSPPSPEFDATLEASYALYKKYQRAVHNSTEDECGEAQYKRFLCDSPLVPTRGAPGWTQCDYGSYHQHYYVDGKLVMVGVVDILPRCLSSVYLYYDPDIMFLSPGVYSALREIEFTRKLYLGNSDFKYYYMGFYVHSCPKMRYKGHYAPSYLACPESHRFVAIELCLPKLDAHKYSVLDDDEVERRVEERVEETVRCVEVLIQGFQVQYGQLNPRYRRALDPLVTEYATVVGHDVGTRMLLVVK
eukprot:Em0011g237a